MTAPAVSIVDALAYEALPENVKDAARAALYHEIKVELESERTEDEADAHAAMREEGLELLRTMLLDVDALAKAYGLGETPDVAVIREKIETLRGLLA